MIYIPEKIKEIIDNITLAGDVVDIVEVGNNSDLTITNYDNLLVGMIITLDNVNYQITAINNNVITIIGTGITSTNWSLAINYLFGHRLEIQEILENKSNNNKTKFKNFPLVWLDLDIDEQKNVSTLIESEATIILVFAYRTKKEYTASIRLENNFKLILQPILNLFIKSLNSPKFNPMFVKEFGTTIDYTKVDRYFYGSNDKNKSVFKTLTDAVEISVNLKFRKSFNCN